MERVSIRLPGHIIKAYDAAPGTRSALMRRRLVEAITEGEVEGVPDDLLTLAEREKAVEEGALARKKGKFKEDSYRFFKERWNGGATTPADIDDLAESWRKEAELYGPTYMAYVDAMVEWYRENYDPAGGQPDWPPAKRFVALSDPESDTTEERVRDVMSDMQADGFDRQEVVQALADRYPAKTVFDVAAELYDDDQEGDAARGAPDGGGGGERRGETR